MRYQPQGALRIAQSGFSNGLVLASIPGVNQTYDASGKSLSTTGTKRVPVRNGLAAGFGAANGVSASDSIATGLSGALVERSYYARFLRSGAGGGALGRIFDKTSAGAGQYMLWHGSLSLITYAYTAGGADVSITIPDSASTNTWMDVIFTHRWAGGISTVNAYLDGVQVVTNSTNSALLSSVAGVPLTIGNRSAGSRNWDGMIEFLHVWDRIISPIEASALYQNPYQLFAAPEEDYESAATNAYTLTASPGAFALSGSTASLKASRRLAASPGALSLSGAAAGLIASRRLAAATGSLMLAGANASLAAARRLPTAGASFALTGSNASLTVARRLAASAGAFTLTGSAANLTYSPAVAARVLVAQAGAFSLTGGAATLRISRRLSADAGSFAISGSAAGFARTTVAITVPLSRTVNFDGGINSVNFGGGTNRVDFDGGTNRVNFGGGINKVTF